MKQPNSERADKALALAERMANKGDRDPNPYWRVAARENGRYCNAMERWEAQASLPKDYWLKKAQKGLLEMAATGW